MENQQSGYQAIQDENKITPPAKLPVTTIANEDSTPAAPVENSEESQEICRSTCYSGLGGGAGTGATGILSESVLAKTVVGSGLPQIGFVIGGAIAGLFCGFFSYRAIRACVEKAAENKVSEQSKLLGETPKLK